MTPNQHTSPSILDLLTPRPHLRLNSHSLLTRTSPWMTKRTADEADLSPDDGECDNIRPKTTNNDGSPDIDATMAKHANKLDLLKFIPIPPLDPLHIHGWDANSTMDNLNPYQVTTWKNDPGAKLFTYKAYGGRIDDRNELTKLRDTITKMLNLPAPPTIAPPSPDQDRGRRDGNPVCALIKDILPEQDQDLITRVRMPHPTSHTI